MSKTFRPYQPDQILMLPPSLNEWLAEDHPVYYVSDVVESLDLPAIYASYAEERGFPPYHPLLMVKVWLYGYACGVRSSRKVERATREDVAFRILCAGNEPDFRTLSDFRRRHLEALGALFSQVLGMGREAGLAKLGHVAIDATEDALYGPGRSGSELPPELANRKTRLKKIQEAKAALEQQAREEQKRSGKGPSTPAPKAQRNFTDPESRIMLNSDKAFVQACNAQLAVDSDHQVIVAADVVQASNDKKQLIPMVEAVVDNCEEAPGAISADAGYWSEANARRMDFYDVPAFIAPEKISHQEWREAKPPRGRIPKGLTTKERMRRKLRTKRGRAEYDKRKITVEPVCGQLKTV